LVALKLYPTSWLKVTKKNSFAGFGEYGCNLLIMKRRLIFLTLLMVVCSQGLAQEKRASLFCGPSHNYYCSPEQEIMAIRRDQLNHQQNQPTTAQQNMARYLDLEQIRRAKQEQELGKIKR
jgi:hypothetical protein